MKLLVKGSDGETIISGQNAIRSALGDSSLTLNRMDGKTSEGWSLLPSGFLTICLLYTSAGNLFAFLGYGCLNIFAYVSMVIAVIILASHYRQIHWFSGWVRREIGRAHV